MLPHEQHCLNMNRSGSRNGMELTPAQKKRTLWLCGLLHAFTHVYYVALLPLYLLITKDLGLASVDQATALMTFMMVAYFLPSYFLGALADRFSRKKILTFGLVINGAGFMALGLSPNYPAAVISSIVAGFGGSFYHPAATALIARLYPVGTGKAFGWVGVGASVGFFISPLYAGWRADSAGWRAPTFELGLFGFLAALLFAWLAVEDRHPVQDQRRASAHPLSPHLFTTLTAWLLFFGAAFAFSLRDFTGTSMGTLGSLFLQTAHGMDLRWTGIALSGIFLASSISNPLFGGLSDRGRLRWTALVLIVSAALVALFPHVSKPATIPLLLVYGFFFLACYPMVEAALMEAVPDSVRGRVFGLFITVGGLIGNLSHWLMGEWVSGLGPDANDPSRYYSIFGLLALLVLFALLGLPCLKALGRRAGPAAAITSPALHPPPSNPQPSSATS